MLQKKPEFLFLFILGFLLWSLPSVAQNFKKGYKQKGVASYYANKFHGKKTASGERFDMYAMTAAHRFLPFNTIVKVTNPKNGKWVTVRINDRGPFTRHRILDVSKAAALKLDLIKQGTATIELEVLKLPATTKDTTPAKTQKPGTASSKTHKKPSKTAKNNRKKSVSKPQTTAKKKRKSVPLKKRLRKKGTYDRWGNRKKPKGYGIQIGAYAQVEKAIELAKEANTLGMKEVYIQTSLGSKKTAVYRVIFASGNQKKVKKLLPTVRSKGFPAAFLKAH